MKWTPFPYIDTCINISIHQHHNTGLNIVLIHNATTKTWPYLGLGTGEQLLEEFYSGLNKNGTNFDSHFVQNVLIKYVDRIH